MKALTKLKDDARKHEQKEEWDKAVQLYLEVIRTAEEDGGDTELPLYNRVGDLFVRMGRPADAVAHYERAADRYAEAGLFNNAIALCNKALRYLPNRTELLRKLGQFSASQGFITEARRWYLEYAERKLKEGALDEAFQALDDFASVHEDADVRETLGRQLLAHNRRQHALEELKKAYDLRVAAGQSDAAVRLMDEILTIEPGAFSADAPSAAAPAAFDTPKVETWGAPPAVEPARIDPADPVLAAPPSGAAADTGLFDLTSLNLPGFETATPEATEPAVEAADMPHAADPFDVPRIDIEPAIGASMPDFEGDAAARFAPIDLDTIDLGGPNVTPAAPVPVDVPADEPPADIDDALIEPLPLIEPEFSDSDEPFDLPLLEDPPTMEPAAAANTGEFEPFETDAPEPLPLLDPEPVRPVDDAAVEPLPEIALDDIGPGVTPAGAEFDFEVYVPPPLAHSVTSAETPVPVDDMLFDAPEPAAASEVEAAAPFELEPVEEPYQPDIAVPFEFEDVAATATSADLPGVIEDTAAASPVEVPPPVESVPPVEAVSPLEAAPQAQEALQAEDDFDFQDDFEYDFEPDWTETFAAAKDFARRGETAAAIEELVILHEGLYADGMYKEALEVIEELVRLEPGNVGHLQQRVEYATRAGDTQALVRAYLDLADRLARSGATVKANAIYQRVLDLDPDNAIARNALYTPPPPPVRADDDGYVDLFELLADEKESSTRFVVAEKPPTGDEERDFADMLSQFKQKIAEHISFDDSASHYDLGLAFKEMGLIDEAIAEFQTALKGGQDRLKIYEELGQCFILKQQHTIAINILKRAVDTGADDADLIGVFYHIGRSYEELGKKAEARAAYERVVGVDISFKDAAERLARL